jgi:hypothetical protein
MRGINILVLWTSFQAFQKLYVIYLFVAVCVTLVRITRLALQLWSFRRKRESLGGDMGDNFDVIAKAALNGNIERASNLANSAEAINRAAILFKVDCIEARFLYLWETCYAKVQSIKALALMTVIISVCVASFGVVDWFAFLKCGELIADVYGGFVIELSLLMAIGFFISAFLYASSFWLQGALARRRTEWNYLKARFREELLSVNAH